MKFWHSGALTANIEKTAAFLGAASGIDENIWTIFEIDFPQSEMVTGDGGKLRAAFARIGGSAVELLEPLDGDSYHAKALLRNGPGFHHNAYICEDNFDKTVSEFLAMGGRIVWEMRHGDEHACYIESADGKTVVELINCCPFMP